ncbi:sulfur carrier protein ThiS [Bermanella sp. R86510]|uniref:sulfur carrier protein ThiS n=1 Tax=unclassified Bermanella TaxID=2627862 RepID=UPI0037C91F34
MNSQVMKTKSIIVNGETMVVEDNASLLSILQQATHELNMDLNHCVVAVNQNLVHRQTYQDFELSAGDEIDILTAVVGG